MCSHPPTLNIERVVSFKVGNSECSSNDVCSFLQALYEMRNANLCTFAMVGSAVWIPCKWVQRTPDVALQR